MIRSVALALSLTLSVALPRPATGAERAAIDAAGAGTAGAASAPGPEPSAATTASGPEPAPATTTAVPEPSAASTTALGLPPGEDTWIDVGHAFLEEKLFVPVVWVDRFFADERDVEPIRSRSFLRVREELRFTQHVAGPRTATNVNLSLVFPSIDKRLERFRIELVGQTQQAFTAVFPGDRTAPADVTAADPTARTADAGLGFRLWEGVQSHGDLGAGVIFRLPPGVYGRVRFRFAQPLGRSFLAREAVTGFWRTDTHLGTTGSAELERPVSSTSLVRLSGTGTITQRSRGFEWGGDLSYIATLFSRVGFQVGYGVSGATKAPVDVDVHHFYVRVRRDVWRRWLFLELAPDYAWPWTPEVGRRGVWSIAFRAELQFQGRDPPRPPTPKAPEPAEPADPPAQGGALPRAPASR